MGAWELLGMEPTQDIRAIKRAYSIKLKTTRPDDDAQAYQALREAYDWAQLYAKHYVAYEVEVEEGGEGEDAVEAPVAEPELQPQPAHMLDPEHELGPEPDHVVPTPTFEATPALPIVAIVAEEVTQVPTVERLLADCTRAWADEGSVGLSRAWPRLQAQLEDTPIGRHKHASRAFAQFVAEESDLPVDVLVGLTRHFQWGLDFKVDQLLGPQLSQALHQRLNVAEVFAAFHPERYTQQAWALALSKLWDEKRRVWAALLATFLDHHTRHHVLQAKMTTLHALGVSRASVPAAQSFVTIGGTLQGILFVLLASWVLTAWAEPDLLPRSALDVVVLGVASLILFFPLREFPGYERFLNGIRNGHNVDWMAGIPVVVAALVFMDHHFAWLAGAASSPTFLYCMVSAYLGIWLLTPTRENPWHTMVLPTFVLLLFGVLEVVPSDQMPLAVSIAFAWTMCAHVVLKRFPHHFGGWYDTLIKLGVLRDKPLYILGIKIIAILWVLMAIFILPILLFRMAMVYRVLYAVAAMVAGAVLAHARSTDWQTRGLVLWVLAAVFCIQIFQTWAQKLAEFGLKKLKR
jgi:hypothetical protein